MISVLLVARKTLLTQPGGDTYQVLQTQQRLIAAGIRADLYLHQTPEPILGNYDILHFFNVGRPDDFLSLAMKSGKPFVVTPIYVDYSFADAHFGGLRSGLLKWFGSPALEYFKTLLRAANGSGALHSRAFILKGWTKSVKYILHHASAVLPHTLSEQKRLEMQFGNWKGITRVIPPGVELVVPEGIIKDPNLVICVARIEKLKNQLGLIRAMKNSPYKLVIIGEAATNQKGYLEECIKESGEKVVFTGQLSRAEVLQWMAKAQVHAMPSFFETTGLSTVESILCGCNVVIAPTGDQEECFEEMAFYCDPKDTENIKEAIEKAMNTEVDAIVADKIKQRFSWEKNIENLIEIYKRI